jgi:hypothetical protein
VEERHRIEEYDHQHLNPLFYGEMKYVLEKHGFEIENVATNRYVKKRKFIHPLLKRIIRKKTKKKYKNEPFYLSDLLLEGEILIFVARRDATPQGLV